jgi:PD-(D/E)XK nuclease superfamily protein
MTGHRDTEMNKYDGTAVDTTDQIIRCAIEVHRHLGPGLLESVYESAITPDLIVGDQVIVEIKSIERFNPVFVAQMLTYLRVTGLRVGLILNFNREVMKDGIRRISL